MLELGKTIVRHPIYKHLCTVEKMKNSQPTTTMKWKVSSRCSVILRSSGGVLKSHSGFGNRQQFALS